MPKSGAGSRRIAFALDYPDLEAAKPVAERLRDEVGVLKIGLELFVREGPPALVFARSLGLEVFADLKLHDIPETVDRAIASVAALGARFVTVHASGGPAMLERAAKRAERESGGNLTVLAVTVLTSLDDADLGRLGVSESSGEHVLRLARLAWEAGVRGFVCSPAEVAKLRQALGPGARLVTPGIRPSSHGASDDQKRVATPAGALRAGADLLVVGRPIRDAPDPVAAARAIAAEIDSALPSPTDAGPGSHGTDADA